MSEFWVCAALNGKPWISPDFVKTDDSGQAKMLAFSGGDGLFFSRQRRCLHYQRRRFDMDGRLCGHARLGDR
jgi:hypothetical protein